MLRIKKTLLSSTICFSLIGCATIPPEKIHPKFYAIDVDHGALVRAQDHIAIDCKTMPAANFTCLSYEDIKAIYRNYVIGCETYKTPEEIQRLIDIVGAYGKIGN